MKCKKEVDIVLLMESLMKTEIKEDDIWVEYFPSKHPRNKWVKFCNKVSLKEDPLGVVILHMPTMVWAECDEEGANTQYNYECCLLKLTEDICKANSEKLVENQ